MRCEFHPEALEEYQDAARYYEGCQSGLGQRFIDAIEHAIQRIVDKPEQWKPLEMDVRRYLTRVFPYAILYSIEADYHSCHGCNALPPGTRILEKSHSIDHSCYNPVTPLK